MSAVSDSADVMSHEEAEVLRQEQQRARAAEKEEARRQAAAAAAEAEATAARLKKEEQMRVAILEYQRLVASTVAFRPAGPASLRDREIWRASMVYPSRSKLLDMFAKHQRAAAAVPDYWFQETCFKKRGRKGISAMRHGFRSAYVVIITATPCSTVVPPMPELAPASQAPFLYWFGANAAPQAGMMASSVECDGFVYLWGCEFEHKKLEPVDGKFRVRIDPSVPRIKPGVAGASKRSSTKDDDDDDGDDNGVEFAFDNKVRYNRFIDIVEKLRLPGPGLDQEHREFMEELARRNQQEQQRKKEEQEAEQQSMLRLKSAADLQQQSGANDHGLVAAAADAAQATDIGMPIKAAVAAEAEGRENNNDDDVFDSVDDVEEVAADGQRELQQSDWMSDDAVTNCCGCNAKFTLTRRKHHCRNAKCLRIFCSTCCPQTKRSEDRRCLDCLKAAQQQN